MSGTKTETNGGSNRAQDIHKDTKIVLVNGPTAAEFQKWFKLDQMVRGALNHWLFRESTEVSEQPLLAMCKKSSNRLNRKNAATELLEVDSVSIKEMFKKY